jgi:hypothetical protein
MMHTAQTHNVHQVRDEEALELMPLTQEELDGIGGGTPVVNAV